MREAIHLHDSILLALAKTEFGLCLRLESYILRPPELGGEHGKCWTQEVEFHFDGVVAVEFAADLPLWIMDGRITGSESHENLIPLPYEIDGDVRFEVSGAEGRLLVRANHFRIHRIGEPQSVEDTPPDLYP